MDLVTKISAALSFSKPRKLSLQDTQRRVKDCLDAYLAIPPLVVTKNDGTREFPVNEAAEKIVEQLWLALYLGGMAPKPPKMGREPSDQTTKELYKLGLAIRGDFGGCFGIQRHSDGHSYLGNAVIALHSLGILAESELRAYQTKFLARHKVGYGT